MIAVPGNSQFFGAMENWGAILYFEPLLLVDPARSSQSDRQDVFEVIAHEMAHQWFGNLVTMELVGRPVAERGLRLVDGRARSPTTLHPEWKPWLQRSRAPRERAHAASTRARRPIRSCARSTSVDAANQAFDVDRLQQGRGRDPDDRGHGRRDCLPRRHPQLHAQARLRQHGHRRPVAGARGRCHGKPITDDRP